MYNYDLPDLTGTRKQIEWANEIRNYFLELFKADERLWKHLYGEQMALEVFEVVFHNNRASYFIDHRYYKTRELLDVTHKKLKTTAETKIKREAAEAEIILIPAEQAYTMTAHVRVLTDRITVWTPYDDNAKELLKRHYYDWDSDNRKWYRKMSDGKDRERAAEIAARLLMLGMAVVLHDEEARQKVIEQSFGVENLRKIFKLTRDDKESFNVFFPYNKELADQLTNIMRAYKRSSGGYNVNAKYTEALIEFAEIHGFEFTPAAAELRDSIPRKVRVPVDVNDLSDLLDEDDD